MVTDKLLAEMHVLRNKFRTTANNRERQRVAIALANKFISLDALLSQGERLPKAWRNAW